MSATSSPKLQIAPRTLDQITIEIHAKFNSLIKRSDDGIRDAIDLGGLLHEAKADPERDGEWLPWVKAKCPFGKSQSADYMQAFTRQDEVLELWQEVRTSGHRYGLNWILKTLRKKDKEQERALKIERGRQLQETGDIHEGDMWLLQDLLPDDSADLFFTDPPYHEDKTSLFGELAELAQQKLKPGGLCLVYSGQMFLPIVLGEMCPYLDYYWIFALRHTGGHLQIWNRKVWNDWKPILVFAKRPIQPPAHDWVMDFQEGGGRDKQFHDWGQDAAEATYWIEMFTEAGGLVVDPFCGGGAIPAACKATGRRWIATEIDPDNAALARGRVS